MEFNCCDFLLYEIVFAQNKILPCCCSPNSNYGTVFLEEYQGQNFNFLKYLEQRNKYVEIFKSGKTPEYCQDCFCIKKNKWDETPKLKRIIISNRTKCSCNCFYCSLVTTSTQTKKELNTRICYDIKPVMSDLKNQNLIDENCLITIAGGECCEYPKGELEHILYIASSLNCEIEILSSGIFYSKAIESVLKTEKATLKISVDSGLQSTYEKIKRVKKYKEVWKNLTKYIKASKNNTKAKVIIKYIILPGVNDNKQEAKAFIEKSKSIGCKNIEITIEYLWFDKNKHNKVSPNLLDTYNILNKSGMRISYEGHVSDYFNNINKFETD